MLRVADRVRLDQPKVRCRRRWRRQSTSPQCRRRHGEISRTIYRLPCLRIALCPHHLLPAMWPGRKHRLRRNVGRIRPPLQALKVALRGGSLRQQTQALRQRIIQSYRRLRQRAQMRVEGASRLQLRLRRRLNRMRGRRMLRLEHRPVHLRAWVRMDRTSLRQLRLRRKLNRMRGQPMLRLEHRPVYLQARVRMDRMSPRRLRLRKKPSRTRGRRALLPARRCPARLRPFRLRRRTRRLRITDRRSRNSRLHSRTPRRLQSRRARSNAPLRLRCRLSLLLLSLLLLPPKRPRRRKA